MSDGETKQRACMLKFYEFVTLCGLINLGRDRIVVGEIVTSARMVSKQMDAARVQAPLRNLTQMELIKAEKYFDPEILRRLNVYSPLVTAVEPVTESQNTEKTT